MVFMRNMVKEIILHMSLITKVMFYKLLLVKKMAGNQSLNTSSRGGTGYAGSLRGNSINFRGNTLTPVTSYISLR